MPVYTGLMGNPRQIPSHPMDSAGLTEPASRGNTEVSFLNPFIGKVSLSR
jgi:hypothetical protein